MVKNVKTKFKIIPQKNEDYVSVGYGCIRLLDSYRFLSSSLDELIETLIENSQKTLGNLKEEIVDYDKILNIVNGIVDEDRTIEDLKKDYQYENEKLEETLLSYIGENDLQVLKREISDKWNYLIKKSAYLYEYFNIIDDF